MLFRSYTCETANGQDFFEIGIDHGKNPIDGTYAYAILPYASIEKLDKYSRDPDVVILSNTDKVQAVEEKGLGIRCYAFHAPASTSGVTVDEACLVTVTRDTIAVSDPTRELEKITLTLDKAVKVVSAHEKMSASVTDGRTVIEIDVSGANGRKYELKYEDA